MTKHWKTIGSWLRDILLFGGIFAAFNSFAYAGFHIPSGSMEPTLLIGDRLYVSKFAYGYSRYSLPFAPPVGAGRIFADVPARGDVAVFVAPEQDNTVFIKRVIGLPGDRVQLSAGRLYINGALVPRRLVEQRIETAGAGRTRLIQYYEESLPDGPVHIIAELGDNMPFDNTPEYIVPAGHVFMMGDNRDNSRDSRAPDSFGFVAMDELVGRADVINISLADCADGAEGCVANLPVGRFFSRIQ